MKLYNKPLECHIKEDRINQGRYGVAFGYFYIEEVAWAIVRWGQLDEPELIKAEEIEVLVTEWTEVVDDL